MKIKASIDWYITVAKRKGYRFGWYGMETRFEFPYVLNSRRLLGEGVEVGVQRGHYSETILNDWTGKKLYSVDPWREFGRDVYVDNANNSQSIHEQYYRETVQRLACFGVRSDIMRCTSEEAALKFKKGQLDFVYIDAQHHYEAVRQDIARWADKIRSGGILAGHDYLDGFIDESQFGVKRAVDEYAQNRGVKVFCTREQYPSWFIVIR